MIPSDGILKVLATGGQIQYRPVLRRKRWEWQLWAAHSGEPLVHVISSKTGEPRISRSANALYAFHLRVFPDSDGVFIPATVHATHARRADTQSGAGGDSDDTVVVE